MNNLATTLENAAVSPVLRIQEEARPAQNAL
jgi:hypothetical protein